MHNESRNNEQGYVEQLDDLATVCNALQKSFDAIRAQRDTMYTACDALAVKLAEMTKARDEACDAYEGFIETLRIGSEARIESEEHLAELRAVGLDKPSTKI